MTQNPASLDLWKKSRVTIQKDVYLIVAIAKLIRKRPSSSHRLPCTVDIILYSNSISNLICLNICSFYNEHSCSNLNKLNANNESKVNDVVIIENDDIDLNSNLFQNLH